MKKAADQQKERAREEAQLILREIEEMDQDHGSSDQEDHHHNNDNNSNNSKGGGNVRGERDPAAIKAAREELQQGGSSVWSGGMALKSMGSMRMKVSGPVSVLGNKQSAASSSSSSSSSGDYMNTPWDETNQDGALGRHQDDDDDNDIDETNPWLSAAAMGHGKTRHATSGQQIHKKKGEKVVVNVEAPVMSMSVASSSSTAKGVKGSGSSGGGGGVIGEVDAALTLNQSKNNNSNNNKRNNKNQVNDGNNDKVGTKANATAAVPSDKRTMAASVSLSEDSKEHNTVGGDNTGKKSGNNKEERKPLLMQKSQEDLVQMAFAGPDYQSDFDHYKGMQ